MIKTALSETCTAGSPAVYTKNNSRTKCQADLIVANTHRARITLSREEERVVQRGKAEWNPVLQGKRSSPSHLQRGCLFRSPCPLSLSPPRVALVYFVYCPGEVVHARIERDSWDDPISRRARWYKWRVRPNVRERSPISGYPPTSQSPSLSPLRSVKNPCVVGRCSFTLAVPGVCVLHADRTRELWRLWAWTRISLYLVIPDPNPIVDQVRIYCRSSWFVRYMSAQLSG